MKRMGQGKEAEDNYWPAQGTSSSYSENAPNLAAKDLDGTSSIHGQIASGYIHRMTVQEAVALLQLWGRKKLSLAAEVREYANGTY